MHERAASLGGNLHIDSEEGGGVRVTLELPLVQEREP
jgi:signal transduction histidine kinase